MPPPLPKSALKPPQDIAVIPTATVLIRSSSGSWHRARAILDTGSETNLITQSAATRCGLPILPTKKQIICGVGGTSSDIVKGRTTSFIFQCYGRPNLQVSFRVVACTTFDIPSQKLPREQWNHLDRLHLADPSYNLPQKVDIIFGAAVWQWIDLRKTLDPLRGSPAARLTTLGWVIIGHFRPEAVKKHVRFHSDLDNNKNELDNKSLSNLRGVQTHVSEENHRSDSSSTYFTNTHSSSDHAIPSVPLSIQHSQPKSQRLKWPPSRSFIKTSHNIVKPKPTTISISSVVMPTACCGTSHPRQKVKGFSHQISQTSSQHNNISSDAQLSDLVMKMYQLESLPDAPTLTPDELKAEEFFVKDTSRTPDGRYVVSLPFKNDPILLGLSRDIACRRLFNMENILRKDPIKRAAYDKFMREYLESGHMQAVPPPKPGQSTYYLPHHAVHRSGDPLNKIRVVFNASQKTTTGISLNEILLPGPRLQLDITDVITRFRFDHIVFTADIKQMFRQILHRPVDREFLRIVWRFSPDDPIQDYSLSTVTYGTSSAPWLACRTLKELADTHLSSHPSASQILSSRTYVDDINGGGANLESALAVRNELINLLHAGGFELRKWASNSPELLSDLPNEFLLPSSSSLTIDGDKTYLKVLGLCWDPVKDQFHYSITKSKPVSKKCEVLAVIARLYDPLGWLAPTVIQARIIFREISSDRIGWRDNVPPSTAQKWTQFQNQLPLLENLRIPRHVFASSQTQYLVGFADASERAYAAVIYLVTQSSLNPCENVSHLIISKARIAPLQPVTVPRLELCSALLLAKLVKRIAPLFQRIDPSKILLFSDSMVSLAWITANPAPTWKVFVGNRVAEILNHSSPDQWFHVRTFDNPADCASRGVPPQDLLNHELWWNGPKWLNLPYSKWPLSRVRANQNDPVVSSEIRAYQPPLVGVTIADDLSDQLEHKFSNFISLRNIVGWINRFINSCRARRTPDGRNELSNVHHRLQALSRNRGSRLHDVGKFEASSIRPLSAEELEKATILLIRRAQHQALQEEILDSSKDHPKLSTTRTLRTWINNDGLLVVGGRLQHSDLPHSTKHQVLLPSKHPLTNLIIDHAHIVNLHVGPSATYAWIRNKFWIINGKNVVRHRLSGCNKCFSAKPKPFQPPMGQLPADRTLGVAPFHIVGVDYAGPFPVRAARIRGSVTYQCYLCIFVCFASKAVHIEVSSDLTTQTFLAAYERFVSIRGRPSRVYSDNGTNFVGANNHLLEVRRLLSSKDHQDHLIRVAALQQTDWQFIPPSSPHFGGLWEAAVKSTKRLLKIITSKEVLSLEAFQTLIAKVSAILNSRPITAISSSPNDIDYLTPGHFLIFRPLTAAPPDPRINERTSVKSQWALVQHWTNIFWRRWRTEYLSQQQSAAKWHEKVSSAKEGQVVILMNDHLPPQEWSLGRIEKLYPGPDGHPRTADVATKTGLYRRALVKLCPLPTQ